MSNTTAKRDCMHGQLRRTCEICELERKLAVAREECKQAEARAEALEGELLTANRLVHKWQARAEAAEGAIRDGIGATVTAWLGSEPAYEVTRALSLARHAAAPQPTTEGACECVGGNITKRVVAKGCPEHDTPREGGE